MNKPGVEEVMQNRKALRGKKSEIALPQSMEPHIQRRILLTRQAQKYESLLGWFMASLQLSCLVGLVPLFLSQRYPRFETIWLTCCGLIFGLGAMGLLLNPISRFTGLFAGHYREALETIGQSEDIRQLSLYLDAVIKNQWAARSEAIGDKLTSLLEQVTEGNQGLLTIDDQRKFRGYFDPGGRLFKVSERQAVAAIQAITKIGNSECLLWLRSIALREPNNGKEKRIVALAQECLSRMEARFLPQREIYSLRQEEYQQEQVQKQTLLRPSEVPSTQLLRPVSENQAADPQELLRPNVNREADRTDLVPSEAILRATSAPEG